MKSFIHPLYIYLARYQNPSQKQAIYLARYQNPSQKQAIYLVFMASNSMKTRLNYF